MGVMDRLRGRLSSLERTSPRRRTHGADDELGDIAGRTISSSELTHFFVASDDARLVEAYYDLFRVGAPAYGGSASRLRGGPATLVLREQDATRGRVRFTGESAHDGRVDEVKDMAQALAALRSAGGDAEAQVAYVAVGRRGADWVREVHATVMAAAVEEVRPRFRMISTVDEAAACYVRDSLREGTVPTPPGVVVRPPGPRRGRPAPALGTA